MKLRCFRECGSQRGIRLPAKETKKPAYRRSLLTLRGINAIEEERRIALKKLFELFDNCMKDYDRSEWLFDKFWKRFLEQSGLMTQLQN